MLTFQLLHLKVWNNITSQVTCKSGLLGWLQLRSGKLINLLQSEKIFPLYLQLHLLFKTLTNDDITAVYAVKRVGLIN